MAVLAPNKALGQHYLHDANAKQRIVQAINPTPADIVLEIGPGPGALTAELLKAGATVIALEKDDRFLSHLADLSQHHHNRLTVHQGDALKTDLSHLTPSGSILAGNLPYNVGTEIVFTAITQHRSHFKHMVFLLQKEVVQRICAQPGDKNWGRLGVWCNLYTHRKKLFDVPPGAFTPPPKVISSVVHLTPREHPLCDVSPKKLDHLLTLTFGQRRKMLRKSLKGYISETTLESLNISPTARPETLTTEQLCTLANAL